MYSLRNFVRYALLALVAVSLGTWAFRTFSPARAAEPGEVLPADSLVVVNFHAAIRCNGCREIDRQTQALLESEFAASLTSGRLSHVVINFEEADNKHFVEEYGLTTSTVVVTRRVGGRDVEWRRLDAVWDHLYQGPAMRAYLREQINAMNPS